MFDMRPSGPRAFGTSRQQVPAWTPSLVGETLLDTMRWARMTAGHTGPRGFARIAGLTWTPTLQDHIEEGWGVPGEPDPEDEREPLPVFTRSQVTLFSAALLWQAKYLVPANCGSSRMLALWLRSRVQGENLTGGTAAARRREGPRIPSAGPGAVANRARLDGRPGAGAGADHPLTAPRSRNIPDNRLGSSGIAPGKSEQFRHKELISISC